MVIGIFVFYAAISFSTVLAAEESAAAKTTTTAVSGEAEKVAANASLMGVSQTVLEGAIFAAALAVMAVAISSDSDPAPPASHGHGHGH